GEFDHLGGPGGGGRGAAPVDRVRVQVVDGLDREVGEVGRGGTTEEFPSGLQYRTFGGGSDLLPTGGETVRTGAVPPAPTGPIRAERGVRKTAGPLLAVSAPAASDMPSRWTLGRGALGRSCVDQHRFSPS